jgi:hypothetical protein
VADPIEPGAEVPLGMANAEWSPPPDNDPAPRLPNGLFIDPDDGTPVWYLIPYRGPDHEWTAGDLRALRPDMPPPPIVGPVASSQVNGPVEFRPESEGDRPAEPELDLSAPARNVTPDGVPHFLRILPEGREVCGGCTRPWPCGQVDTGLEVQNTGVTPDGRPAQIEVGLDQLAVARGQDVNDLERVVEQLRREEIARTGVDPFAGIIRAEDEGRRYAG